MSTGTAIAIQSPSAATSCVCMTVVRMDEARGQLGAAYGFEVQTTKVTLGLENLK